MKIIQLLLEYNREKTIATYGKKIEIANQNDKQHLSSEQIISKIEEVDPSINKQYVQWICKQYISGVLKVEDLYKVTEPLIIFQKFKNRLPQEKRDINKLTIFDLHDIEEQISKPQLNNKNNNESKEQFGPDVKVWYNGPLGYLITPLTKEAAKKYSKGTRWCTGAENENANKFDDYNSSGSLFIWKDKNGEKYQFSIDSNEYVDSHDEPIDDETILVFKKHPVLKELLLPTGKIHLAEQQEIYKKHFMLVKKFEQQMPNIVNIDITSDIYKVFETLYKVGKTTVQYFNNYLSVILNTFDKQLIIESFPNTYKLSIISNDEIVKLYLNEIDKLFINEGEKFEAFLEENDYIFQGDPKENNLRLENLKTNTLFKNSIIFKLIDLLNYGFFLTKQRDIKSYIYNTYYSRYAYLTYMMIYVHSS